MFRTRWGLAVAIVGLTICLRGTGQVEAGITYVTGPDPWGSTSNDSAMNTAFGSGNWTKDSFSSAVGNGLFTPGNNSFIFIDGGDGTDSNFVNFLVGNVAALQNWVAAGGSLLMTAATWNYSSFNIGFNATSNAAYDNGRYSASATDPLHPLFDATTGTTWSGNYFSHNDITGLGLTSLIKDGFGRDILVDRTWGAGYVMLGGLTTTNWHSPPTEAFNLRVNMLEYAAARSAGIPEPISLAVWSGLSLSGIGLAALRRRKEHQRLSL